MYFGSWKVLAVVVDGNQLIVAGVLELHNLVVVVVGAGDTFGAVYVAVAVVLPWHTLVVDC